MAPIDTLCVNAIRVLSAEAVQKANSGHPGLPLGAAPMAYALWKRHLAHNPTNPDWADRDRFVLSGGHGSMLLYSLLHLFGYDLSIEDLKNFRQWESRTPGHPENFATPGVEATTGPLGQGISTAVGMAMAEAHLAAVFNEAGHSIVDHRTWVLASDGDLMEGVAAEACSLAGHLGLGKLNVLYDDNAISLAASTSICFTEDVPARFRAYGWHTVEVADGNDLDALDAAMEAANAETERPTLISVKTVIGFGSPNKAGTPGVHGSPLGPEELAATKKALDWPSDEAFAVPAEATAHFATARERGAKLQADWQSRFDAYDVAHPEKAAEFRRRMAGKLPAAWGKALLRYETDAKGLATRKAGGQVLNGLAAAIPEIVGGSADLNPSTFTALDGLGDFHGRPASGEGVQGSCGGVYGPMGRNVHFGVREHGMGAAVNGMALHGGVIPFGATFLQFADYMRAAIRLSALMRIGSVWVFTHDSVALGEDGPTHQPVEHFMALRAIPDLLFIRPADANETAEAWRVAIENRDRPTALALSRQNCPTLDRSQLASAEGLRRGAYVLNPTVSDPELILIATGSEVSLALDVAAKLTSDGRAVRVVSMPCWELFQEQGADYRESVLPAAVPARLSIEAGISLGWERWIGNQGESIAIDRFGASAPAAKILEEFGFTVDAIAARAKALLGG